MTAVEKAREAHRVEKDPRGQNVIIINVCTTIPSQSKECLVRKPKIPVCYRCSPFAKVLVYFYTLRRIVAPFPI